MTFPESRAICRYLALKYYDKGGRNLISDPKDLKVTALFEQWASVELTNFDAYVTVLVAQQLFLKYAFLSLFFPSRAHTFRLRGIEPIAEVADWARNNLSAKLDIYEKILTKQKYMSGDKFSIIDIFYMPFTKKLFDPREGTLIESRPNVKAWWDRVTSRASWKHDIDPAGSEMWAALVSKLG
jgi:glutathione S-transferase